MIQSFFNLIWMILPLFLLGIAIGSLIETKLSQEWVLKQFKHSRLSLFKVIAFAAIIPGCACATMPIAKSLKEKQISTPQLVAFIMMSPLLGAHTILLTFFILGSNFGFARLLFAFLGSFLIGLIAQFLVPFLGNVLESEAIKSCCTGKKQNNIFFKSFVKNFIETLKSLTPYILIGVAIAVLLESFLPSAWVQYLQNQPKNIFLYVLMAVIGIPMYVCEAEEIPLALGLLNAGVPEGLAFTFLLASVGTCIPTALMAVKILGIRWTVFYWLYWLNFAVCSGLIFSFFT